MGAAEETRAGVARYRDAVNRIAGEISGVAGRLEQAIAMLSSRGPIGRSENPDLLQAQGHLAVAWQSAKQAEQDARRSREPVQAFADRMFPG